MSCSKNGAEKIVDYLRTQGALYNSSGITFTSKELGEIIDLSRTQTFINIRKLINAGILVLKKGLYRRGGRLNEKTVPYFVLAQEYEQGDSWKERLEIKTDNGSGNANPPSPKPSRDKLQHLSRLSSVDMLQAHAETMTKLEKALTENNGLRRQLLQALKDKRLLADKIVVMEAEMSELRANEREAQQQLIEADNAIVMASRQIAEQERQKAKLDHQISAYK